MSEPPDIPPFHIQPVLSDIYQSKDLLDLSAPGESFPGVYNCLADLAHRYNIP